MAQLIINKVHSLLAKKRKTIAVAESCTGGLVSELLTRLPGSSKFFALAVVTYANQAKEDLLSIPSSLLAKRGAVSQGVALRMAHAVRLLAGADLALGITGIAGPGGATARKPVGTVFIALESAHMKICRRFTFKGNRTRVRISAAQAALRLVQEALT